MGGNSRAWDQTFETYAKAVDALHFLKTAGPCTLGEVAGAVGNATLTMGGLALLSREGLIDVDVESGGPWYEPAYDVPSYNVSSSTELRPRQHWWFVVEALEFLSVATVKEILWRVEAHGWVTASESPQRVLTSVLCFLERKGVVERRGRVRRKYSSRMRLWTLWRLTDKHRN